MIFTFKKVLLICKDGKRVKLHPHIPLPFAL